MYRYEVVFLLSSRGTTHPLSNLNREGRSYNRVYKEANGDYEGILKNIFVGFSPVKLLFLNLLVLQRKWPLLALSECTRNSFYI